jgi:hypothetical protein
MSRKAVTRFGKRAAARLRAIRLRAAEWKRRARRAATLALIAAGTAAVPSLAEAQMGQMAMAPAGGVVNRAVAGFQQLSQNGPGYLYYGINAADRGLGYNGSYMTLGGFIPYSEDDLGGLWSADLRGHLSVNGGFFSNVGLVRKQFLGGSLLGIGVYWDYDGDQNQYPAFGVAGTEFGQFGHSYNQVGVSGEWLTDFGNLRSNGYMPVGRTAHTAGAPGSPFYQNYVMCQYGLDAALTGADLEVGAYIPGLSDWAGMISVGGYALGNSRYNWWSGPQTGQDVVPWFGGVYTRLDMTFIENWDFSLQANNDSYFDWTGFARLTYRMGGSRRRNVPDQMEQPMMRNEHIVRAHQTPIVALNGSNGNTPWRVIHVDNAAPTGGTGTAESPLTTLAAASAAATNPYDIVFVHRGLSRTSTPYGGTFAFGNENQYLVGDGLGFQLPTLNCGPFALSTGSGLSPLLSNPAGDSIAIDGAIAAGATVAGIDIIGSRTGIYATGPLATTAGRGLTVENVSITGNGTTASQAGVYLEAASGKATFTETQIANMTNGGLVVTAAGGGPLDLDYQGTITSDTALNGGAVSPIVYIADTAGGTINVATGGGAAGATVPNQISDTGGSGIQITGNAAATAINIGNVSLKNNVQTAIAVVDDAAITTITADSGTGIFKQTNGAAISVLGGSPTFSYTGPITNGLPTTGASSSYLLSVANTTGGSVALTAPDTPFIDTGNGITINNAGGDVTVGGVGAKITSAGGQGILIDGAGSSGKYLFQNTTILGATNAGVLINGAPGSTGFEGLTVNLTAANAVGLQATNAGPITALLGANSITNASTSQAAVEITGTGPIDMSFTSIASGNITATPASPTALMFDTSPGTFNVTSQFLVGGSPGSTSNVTNDGGTTVNLPP